MSTDQPSASSPVFVLTSSRAGSTLLRFILDSHPEFACPPESSTPAACAQLARTWSTLENAGSAHQQDPTGPIVLSPRAADAIRGAVDDAYADYLTARGKTRWVDKSLETYQFTDVVLQVFPDARFIVLTRHCMDVIASGVEICPWGLSRFGFDPYVAQFPGNSVAAIGSYWLACTQANLAFAEQHPEACHLLRYEDLVTAPEDRMAEVFSFLGAQQAPGVVGAAFRTPHEGDGPGDEKIWFTTGVTSDSMGRGIAVPAAALPPPLRGSINEALAKLDYQIIDDRWKASMGHFDPRATPPEQDVEVDVDAGAEARSAMAAIAARITSRLPAELGEIARHWPSMAGTSIKIAVQSADGTHEELRWRFPDSVDDGDSADDPGDAEPVIIGTPACWSLLLEGRSNFITEIATGRLRCVNPSDAHRIRSDELHAVARLLGLASIPVARRPAEMTP